ncbi:hypothetical protein GCM10022220_44240 [Actinocatenispora rupis]|uniref:Uncharacterized protein n=1 Tax=Actinocatenispora rupis TaxID=519421 RepID=A0A8J3JAT6_9ACTN|nr:hypothetical protein Aru02nite_58450 [Actinocatenispora rupis]
MMSICSNGSLDPSLLTATSTRPSTGELRTWLPNDTANRSGFPEPAADPLNPTADTTTIAAAAATHRAPRPLMKPPGIRLLAKEVSTAGPPL